MKKFIIVTTINPPTRAIREFSKKSGWNVVVVADKKTPDWPEMENVYFLSMEKQRKLPFSIVEHLPFNHYCRKMIGYLYAMSEGAEIIYDTDDDNLPNEYWDSQMSDICASEKPCKSLSNNRWINIYRYFTDTFCWPRGYPLEEVLSHKKAEISEGSVKKVGIWQFLADDDPDVDAIYRLTNGARVRFTNRESFVLDTSCYCPFNSQNTLFKKQFFSLLYLPAFVTFRFTDILRGIVAQPVLWEFDHYLGFGPATVYQERNQHNLMQDFEQEVPMYFHAEKIPQLLESSNLYGKGTIEEALEAAYHALHHAGIVTSQELSLFTCWKQDVSAILNSSKAVVQGAL